MPAESWPCGATITTTSGRIPHWAIGVQQKRAGRLSNLRAPRPARLPNPKPTTINPKDSRYERGTTGGQVTAMEFRNEKACLCHLSSCLEQRFGFCRSDCRPAGAYEGAWQDRWQPFQDREG